MGNDAEDLLRKNQSLESLNQDLRARLEEAEEALRAIRAGEVDALIVYGKDGEKIYTLQGADFAYRVMIESIHEGAACIAPDGTVLYCNKRLAEMLGAPLETVLGSWFTNYLDPADREIFHALAQKAQVDAGRSELKLAGPDGQRTPALVSASAVQVDGAPTLCLVVTDLSEQKQAAARERELQTRLMEQLEEERVRIARNLHDGPLQELISLSFTLEGMITAGGGRNTGNSDDPAGSDGSGDLAGSDGSDGSADSATLSELDGMRRSILKLAGDLRSVCNELRPPNTIRFGLAKAIRYQTEELLNKYPHLTFNFDLTPNSQTLSKEISATLFRIYQECLNNVIRHSRATQVDIRLLMDPESVLLEVEDNGQGFQPPQDWVELARQGHLGLVGMRERAEAAGGKMTILTGPGRGTTIQVEVPMKR